MPWTRDLGDRLSDKRTLLTPDSWTDIRPGPSVADAFTIRIGTTIRSDGLSLGGDSPMTGTLIRFWMR